jgi:hypothetical protein
MPGAAGVPAVDAPAAPKTPPGPALQARPRDSSRSEGWPPPICVQTKKQDVANDGAASAPHVDDCEDAKSAPAASARIDEPQKACDIACANPEQIGTGIHFVKSPPEAFKKARAENKLVYVMHLSGNFEDKGFT